MITLLSRLFIRNYNDYKDPCVRRSYGILCGIFGIVLNFLLFCFKIFAGIITASIAITADAFNNLGDTGSSIITLLGFRMACKKADREHPFGHGRMEYISGLIVSIAILIMGFELAKTSVNKIIHPQTIEFSILTVVILIGAILVKLYVWFYNYNIGKKINSVAMNATAKDALSDMLSTFVVLAATLVSSLTGFSIDGWCGILVAIFIFITGITAIRDTIGPLLGEPPEPELIHEIESIVLSHPEVVGMHDLIVHNYGPGRVMISLHAEVSADDNILLIHDTIDNIERELIKRTGAHAVIHMDPVVTNDERLNTLNAEIQTFAKTLGDSLTIHDFRMVDGPTHVNLIFDVLVPYRFHLSDEELKKAFSDFVQNKNEHYYTIIEIDKDYNKIC